MVPGIMHTYHARHVVATRPGLPPSSDAVGAEYGGHLPRATIILGLDSASHVKGALMSHLTPLHFPGHHTFSSHQLPLTLTTAQLMNPHVGRLAAAPHLIN